MVKSCVHLAWSSSSFTLCYITSVIETATLNNRRPSAYKYRSTYVHIAHCHHPNRYVQLREIRQTSLLEYFTAETSVQPWAECSRSTVGISGVWSVARNSDSQLLSLCAACTKQVLPGAVSRVYSPAFIILVETKHPWYKSTSLNLVLGQFHLFPCSQSF
jgi:hypothetical protein